MVISDLENMKVKKVRDPPYIKKGISSLESKKDLVIRSTDKGGLVVISKSFYKDEMQTLLGDRNTYQILKNDPVFQYKKQLSLLVHKGLKHKLLTKREADFLDPSACRTPIIYCLPKFHKDAQSPPGDPL